ncbi:MAG: ATP-binding cassette domain-containing protein [Acidimicrobiales bacterium]
MAGSGTAHLGGPDDAVLRVTDLTVEFPVGNTGLKVHAVSGISFDIRKGETMGLVGESGCGKSTTGRALMQVPRPTSGRVVLEGEDLAAYDRESIRAVRARLQMIFQDPISSLNPRRTIAEIVREPLVVQWLESVPRSPVARLWHSLVRWMLPLWRTAWRFGRFALGALLAAAVIWIVGEAVDVSALRGVGVAVGIVAGIAAAPLALFIGVTAAAWLVLVLLMGPFALARWLRLRAGRAAFLAEADEKVRRALSTVGLDPDVAMPKRRHEFSGGQCQRICIARALVLEPKLLICDEPVSALDVSVQAQILNLLEDMKAEYGLTLVFISHDLAVVKNVSDRVAVMYLGKMCEVAPPDLIYSEPAHPYTAALLSAIPAPDPTINQRGIATISGEVPSPVFPPSGCRFRTRCPRATGHCEANEPLMREVRTGHYVACHFPLVGEPAPGATRGEDELLVLS